MMRENSGPSLLRRCGESLDRVSRSPACFFLVLCALRALTRPYAGLVHDAKLYAVQVMNRAMPGFFAEDLFFLYGSQDDYSLFSMLMGPLAAKLGLAGSFFLAHFACTALMIYAEIRLVRRLIPDRLAANLALVLLVVTDLPYAGYNIFQVHEPFLTARVPACAVVLLGLEQLLQKRPGRALMLILLAMLMHPLMAFGGLCVVVAAVGVARLPAKVTAALVGALLLATGGVLLYQPLGTRLFGYFDPAWYAIVQRRNPFLFPSRWHAEDWCRIAFSLAVVIAACRYLDRDSRRVVRLVALLAVAGVIGSIVAELWPYALLLQGQPFRALWLLQFLAMPLGAMLALRLWQRSTFGARFGATLVICFIGRLLHKSSLTPETIVCTLTVVFGLFVLSALTLRSRRQRPADSDWIWPSVLTGLGGYAVFASLAGLWVFAGAVSAGGQNPLILWQATLGQCSIAVLAAGGLCVVGCVCLACGTLRRAGLAMAAIWIGASTTMFAVEDYARYRDRFIRDYADIAFVRSVVDDHWRDEDRPAVVYWPTDGTHIWLGLPAVSFYSWEQTVGALFSREKAVEGERRLLLVRRFEIARMRELDDQDWVWARLLQICQSNLDEPAPTRGDLRTLAREEPLDFIVLRQRFDGLFLATNGEVFVYNCRTLRAGSGR